MTALRSVNCTMDIKTRTVKDSEIKKVLGG